MEFRARQFDVSDWGQSCRQMMPGFMVVVPHESRRDGACIDEIPETFDAARLCGPNALIPPYGARPPGREKCNRETGYNSINACGCCRIPVQPCDHHGTTESVHYTHPTVHHTEISSTEMQQRYHASVKQRNDYMWWIIGLLVAIIVIVGMRAM
jgi:hypothetical protein